jgi:hypothetical protein
MEHGTEIVIDVPDALERDRLVRGRFIEETSPGRFRVEVCAIVRRRNLRALTTGDVITVSRSDFMVRSEVGMF